MLLCIRESNGEFLRQASWENLPSGDRDGEMAIFNLSADPLVAKSRGGASAAEVPMNASIYPTPTTANNTLFVVTKGRLYAITSSSATAAKTGTTTKPPAAGN